MSIVSNKPNKSNPPFYYYSGKGWKIDTKVKVDGKFRKLSKGWYSTLNEAKMDFPKQAVLLQERIRKAENTAPNNERTWGEFEEEFITYRKTQVRGSSLCLDKQRIAKYIAIEIDKHDGASKLFTQIYARNLQTRVMSSDLTRKTKNKVIGLYMQMLEYAFLHEFLANDSDYRKAKAEIHRIKTVEQEDEIKEKVALKDNECIALLQAIDEPHDKLLVTILLETGLRIGEALALRPMDFDFENLVLRVTRTVALDENGTPKVFNRTKTRLGVRSIPIRSDFALIVQSYIDNFDIDDDELLFSAFERRANNAVVMDKSAFIRRLKSYCKKAKIPTISPHCLRHTFATRLSYNCHSDAERQARAYIMGHSLTVDEEIYTAHNQLEVAKGLIR